MKNIQNDSRRWIPFGAVKHLAVRLGIGTTLTLSIAACVPMVDRCASVDTESARVIGVVVDDEILFWTIQSSGECTELVELVGGVGYREWETKMTGPVGSTCTVRLDLGSKIREKTTKVVAYSDCGYPGAEDITFDRE